MKKIVRSASFSVWKCLVMRKIAGKDGSGAVEAKHNGGLKKMGEPVFAGGGLDDANRGEGLSWKSERWRGCVDPGILSVYREELRVKEEIAVFTGCFL